MSHESDLKMNTLQAKSPNGTLHVRTTKHNYTHVIFGQHEGRWCEYRWTREPHLASAVENAKRQGYKEVTAIPIEPGPKLGSKPELGQESDVAKVQSCLYTGQKSVVKSEAQLAFARIVAQLDVGHVRQALENARLVAALEVLVRRAERRAHPTGAAIELCVSGNGESWSVFVDGQTLSVPAVSAPAAILREAEALVAQDPSLEEKP